MRNWNNICIRFIDVCWCVASLPMRNWNTCLSLKNERKKISCEPTYEELKLCLKIDFLKAWHCCEPTYEELKLQPFLVWWILGIRLRAYLWGIETWTFLKILKVWQKLRAYLWGIETSKGRYYLFGIIICCEPTYEELKQRFRISSFVLIERLRAYLWGIETSKELSHQVSLWSCEPTYEELKLFIFVKHQQTLYRLRAYLWGIETCSPKSTKKPSS